MLLLPPSLASKYLILYLHCIYLMVSHSLPSGVKINAGSDTHLRRYCLPSLTYQEWAASVALFLWRVSHPILNSGGSMVFGSFWLPKISRIKSHDTPTCSRSMKVFRTIARNSASCSRMWEDHALWVIVFSQTHTENRWNEVENK